MTTLLITEGSPVWTPPSPLQGGEVQPSWVTSSGGGTGTCTAPATMSGVLRIPLTIDWSAIPESALLAGLILRWSAVKVAGTVLGNEQLYFQFVVDPTLPPPFGPRSNLPDGVSDSGVVTFNPGIRPAPGAAAFVIWPQVVNITPTDPLGRPTLALDWIAWGNGFSVEADSATAQITQVVVEAEVAAPAATWWFNPTSGHYVFTVDSPGDPFVASDAPTITITGVSPRST